MLIACPRDTGDGKKVVTEALIAGRVGLGVIAASLPCTCLPYWNFLQRCGFIIRGKYQGMAAGLLSFSQLCR